MKLFLIGLMGSGKSFWADKLSAVLNIPSFHLDDEIEKSEGKTVSEIFTQNGETYFRQKENEVLRTFAIKENLILSTGGGTPCFFDNMDWMNANGITIWIDEAVETIAERLRKEKSQRPLIAAIDDDKLEDFFIEMHNRRQPFYAKAKHQVSNDNITEENLLNIILSNE